VVLRSGNNRCWARSQLVEATSYTLDEFYRVTQQEMSGYSAHGNFVHLYINGIYEGVYNLVERYVLLLCSSGEAFAHQCLTAQT